MKKVQILLFSVLAVAETTALANGTSPQLQQGQSIYGFLAANPGVQKTWTTAEDRKRAALEKFAANCVANNTDCDRLKNSDRLAGGRNNHIVANFHRSKKVK